MKTKLSLYELFHSEEKKKTITFTLDYELFHSEEFHLLNNLCSYFISLLNMNLH